MLNIPHMINAPPRIDHNMEYIGPLTKCHHKHAINILDDAGNFTTMAFQTYPIPLCLAIASSLLQILLNHDATYHEEVLDLSGSDIAAPFRT